MISAKIGIAIKERRKTLSITQRELADLSGVSINTLTKIERGEANPSLKVLISLLDTLGLGMELKIKKNNISCFTKPNETDWLI
jgi:y4mF family transcriptional regulator